MKELACIALVCVLAALLNAQSESFWTQGIEATRQTQEREAREYVKQHTAKPPIVTPEIIQVMQEWEARKAKEAEESKRAMFVH